MILLKTPEEIILMAEGGAKLRRVATALTDAAREGVTLKELDQLARKLMKREGGEPAFLGYKPAWARKAYGAAICASINNVIVHGLPGRYALKKGDILKIDTGMKYNGWYTDLALTVGIGEITDEAQRLIKVTRDALLLAIDQCVVGNTIGDIGFAINAYVRKNGFNVAQELSGHGIGRSLHEDPVVKNEGKPGAYARLEAGMVLAIEPMVVVGSGEILQIPSDESFATKDGGLSAHFEDTVAITVEGGVILTK